VTAKAGACLSGNSAVGSGLHNSNTTHVSGIAGYSHAVAMHLDLHGVHAEFQWVGVLLVTVTVTVIDHHPPNTTSNHGNLGHVWRQWHLRYARHLRQL
jgi:hypothetical protein